MRNQNSKVTVPPASVYQAGRAEEFGLPPAPEAQGREGFGEWRLKVSVIYRVTNTEKVGDILRKIFGS